MWEFPRSPSISNEIKPSNRISHYCYFKLYTARQTGIVNILCSYKRNTAQTDNSWLTRNDCTTLLCSMHEVPFRKHTITSDIVLNVVYHGDTNIDVICAVDYKEYLVLVAFQPSSHMWFFDLWFKCVGIYYISNWSERVSIIMACLSCIERKS